MAFRGSMVFGVILRILVADAAIQWSSRAKRRQCEGSSSWSELHVDQRTVLQLIDSRPGGGAEPRRSRPGTGVLSCVTFEWPMTACDRVPAANDARTVPPWPRTHSGSRPSSGSR
jgi:hypothetical protein